MKSDYGKLNEVVQNDGLDWKTEKWNEQDPDRRRKDNLADMEPARCRDIHVGVTVVHPVKTPEERDTMIDPVPPICPAIENQE